MLEKRKERSGRQIRLIAALALAACSDPADPCDASSSCVPRGVDLVVFAPDIAAWPGMTADPATGFPYVRSGDSIDVEFRVINRGSERSESVGLHICAQDAEYGACPSPADTVMPPLRSGAEFGGVLRIPVARLARPENQYAAVIVALEEGADDSDPGNNSARRLLHIADPRIVGNVFVPSEVRVGQSYAIPFWLINNSPTKPVPADTLFLCVEDDDVGGCVAQLYPVVTTQLTPQIPPRGELRDTLHFELPTSAIGNSVELPHTTRIFGACVGRADFADAAAPWGCLRPTRATVILPDLDFSCAALAIAPGSIVAGETVPGRCDLRIGEDVQVWSFEALAGSTFTASVLESERASTVIEAVDHDGSWTAIGETGSLTFTIPASGRYHLAVGNAGQYRLSLMLE